MSKKPKITIITPTLNQADYIEETIRSVLSQNYPNLEYIVVDGGSKDNTLEILRKYSSKIKFSSKIDKNQTQAVNRGVKKASGNIISYLNSDDLLLPNSLFEVAEFFQSNKKYLWVAGKCHIINEKGKEVDFLITHYKNFWLKYKRSKNILGIINYISQPAVFWKRSVMEKIGYFDERLNYAMDYDYWLRLIKIYQLGFINHNLASFRVHKKAKSRKNLKSMYQENNSISKKYCGKTIALLNSFHNFFAQIFQ